MPEDSKAPQGAAITPKFSKVDGELYMTLLVPVPLSTVRLIRRHVAGDGRTVR